MMQDPEIITVSIYRTDKRKLRAIAIANDLLDLKNHPSIREAVHHVMGSAPENQILLTFKDKETADYVRLVCRRKGTHLAQYILDNFEWDDPLPCLVDLNETHESSKEICEGCDQLTSGNCPDGLKAVI
jgi:hypothetical protein